MAEDCQTRIKKEVKKRLDELDFVRRKESYSETISTLIDFYCNHNKQNGRKRTQ